ncbi:MAG: hypothetical protein HPAVJP_2650 [Candidatus Hepatoplasma vulgare]|nr:MAG: hypothetical protein HPAVJP_2650 [Candidatus Hepatoplasma sp.]
MSIEIKKIVNKEDWKKFNNWIQENKIFSNDSTFFTDLLNINQNKKYKNSFYEFYFFNSKFLDNAYTIFDDYTDKSEKKILNNNNNFLNFFLSLFIYKNPKLKNEWEMLFMFFKNLDEYLKKDKKDYNREFEIVQDYWNFINFLFENKIKNFNNWVLLINSHVYKKSKGFI